MTNFSKLLCAIFSLAVLLSFSGCKTRKVVSDKQTYSDQSVIKQEKSAETVTRDTSRIISKTKEQLADSSNTVIRIYPSIGQPFTLSAGETFSGTADSITIHKKNNREIISEQLKDEKNAIESTATTREKEVIRSDIKSTVKTKDISSYPNVTLVIVLAASLTAAGIILYILYRRTLK